MALIELRENATALTQDGAVEIPTTRWCELARQSGVTESLIDALLAAWLQGDERNPPFLKSPEPGFFTLADAYGSELAMLLSAGQKEIDGRSWVKRRRKFSRR
jgi:hypothetical protein